MADDGNVYLWAFLRYAEANPYNSLNSVHWDEIKAMMKLYAPVNLTSGDTSQATDPGVYNADTDIPGKTTANGDDTGIDFSAPTSLLTDQALYPESHIFTAVPA